MVIYDKHYKKLDYFGQPYKKFVDFFAKLNPKGTLLDLGCGQGRDSLAMAKLGYNVTGVDVSKVGIDQMLLAANKLNLPIKGIVGDVYTFNDISNYDVILLDSMLHFYKKDIDKETKFVKKIMNDMKLDSIFCNLLLKLESSEKYFKQVIKVTNIEYQVLYDDYVDYKEANCKYHMYVIRKIAS